MDGNVEIAAQLIADALDRLADAMRVPAGGIAEVPSGTRKHRDDTPIAANTPKSGWILPYGKHEGTPIELLPRSYVQWLLEKSDMYQKPDKQEDPLRLALLALYKGVTPDAPDVIPPPPDDEDLPF